MKPLGMSEAYAYSAAGNMTRRKDFNGKAAARWRHRRRSGKRVLPELESRMHQGSSLVYKDRWRSANQGVSDG